VEIQTDKYLHGVPEDFENLPDPIVLAREIMEDL